jgi:hypothetical protein
MPGLSDAYRHDIDQAACDEWGGVECQLRYLGVIVEAMFLSKLVIENADSADDGQWLLMRPLRYYSEVVDSDINVPAGFKTDLASVPRLPVVYLLTGDTSNEAAVVHDYLYAAHLFDRKTADAVLLEASAVTGVPAWRRYLMWAAVRLFGSSHWDK